MSYVTFEYEKCNRDGICADICPRKLITFSKKEFPEIGSLPLESCVIAMTTFDLAATGLGLGACWAGLFMVAAAHHPPIKTTLQIPQDHMIYGALAAGYPKYAYKRIPPRNRPAVNWF